MTPEQANLEGYDAAFDGKSLDDNPYAEDTAANRAWSAGYLQGDSNLREIRNGA